MPRNATSPAAITRNEKIRKAIALRRAGTHPEVIAEELDVSVKTVYNYIKAGLQASLSETGDDLRKLQLDRYNNMLVRLSVIAQNPEHEDYFRALDRIIVIMDKITSLEGIEAPKRVEHDHTGTVGVLTIDGTKDDYIRSLREMAGEAPLSLTQSQNNEDLFTDDEDIIDAELVE